MSVDDEFLTRLKPHLLAALVQSAHSATANAMPVAPDIRALVAGREPTFVARLSAEERFFVFEVSPETARRVDVAVVAPAYCAALSIVPGDWWGTPGAVNTEAGQRLVALGTAAVRCLNARFDDPKRLVYHQGEANTQAKSLDWIIGDLAAGFAAAILKKDYDHRAAASERKRQRDTLCQQLLDVTSP